MWDWEEGEDSDDQLVSTKIFPLVLILDSVNTNRKVRQHFFIQGIVVLNFLT